MIIGLVFSFIIAVPLVTYVFSGISLGMSIKKRKENITTYAIVLNIIAILIAIAFHVYNAIRILNA